MKRFKAVVIGGSGYGGAEMIRRLLMHPDVELSRVVSVDHVGEPLGAVHPSLAGRTDLRFENVPPAQAAQGCDVALLGLPHKVSAQHAPEILAAMAPDAKIVDMSGDFRLNDAAAYARYYGGAHPHPELLGTLRLRPAGAQPRGDQTRAAPSRRRAASRPPSSWRCCRWRAPASCAARSTSSASPARRAAASRRRPGPTTRSAR